MRNELISIPVTEAEKVSGILSIPDSGEIDTAIIIAHGAGNDMNNPMLKYFAEGLADSGYLCLRFNFLYKEKGKKSPDNPSLLYSAWNGAYRALVEHPRYRPRHILAAGKSMGGRIASQMAAEKELPVERLIFLGYPLHAPGRTDRLRDSHLYEITVPMLFFAGTRDSLCDLQLLRQVLAGLAAPRELEVIAGGDHSFQAPKSYAIDSTKIYEQLLRKTVEWLDK
ncbi:MAG: alpha/beta fold hydrolase [Syntrophobacteraceae bacterium]